MAKRKYVYTPRSDADIRSQLDMRGGSFSPLVRSKSTFSVKEGDYTIRILPPTWDMVEGGRSKAKHFGVNVYVHYKVGPDRKSFVCPYETLDKRDPCPVCEERQREGRRPDKNVEAFKAMYPTRRVLVYLIDRAQESIGPQTWLMPWTLDKAIMKKASPRRGEKEHLQIDNLVHGYDIFFSKEGVGLQTDYSDVELDRGESPLSSDPEKQDQWMDVAFDNPLPDLVVCESYETILAAVSGGAAPEQDDGPPPRSRRDDEEVVEDDPPPRRGRSRNDEDEAEEAPPRRGRDRLDDDEPPRQGRSRDAEEAVEDDPPPRPGEDDDPPPRRGRSRDDDEGSRADMRRKLGEMRR